MARLANLEIRTVILVGAGFMTMFHQVILFPYGLYSAIIAALAIFAVLDFIARKESVTDISRYLCWYGTFVVFIFFSQYWTVNTINPDYVLKRVSVIFVLGFIVAVEVKGKNQFLSLSYGLVAGAFAVAATVFVNERTSVFIRRIGEHTVGSAVTFSSILLVAFYCTSWRAVFMKRWRVFNLVLSTTLFVMIILSGTRRALLLSLMFPLLLLLMDRNSSQSQRLRRILSVGLVVIVVVIILLNNPTLYDVVGYRVEGMMDMVLGGGSAPDESMTERNTMQEYAAELFRQRPIAGFGVHGFAYEFLSYYGKLLYSHAGLWEILSCYGILGFIFFYWPFAELLAKFHENFVRRHVLTIFCLVFVSITLLSETSTIAFLVPQTIVLLTVSMNVLLPNANQKQSVRAKALPHGVGV